MPTTSFMEWRYVVEVQTTPDDDTSWRSVHTDDDKDQAIKVAKENPRKARVRQFKVTIIREKDAIQGTTIQPKLHSHGTESVVALDASDRGDVPSPDFDFFCPSHPNRTSRALATSRPDCPDCHKEMFQGTPEDMT